RRTLCRSPSPDPQETPRDRGHLQYVDLPDASVVTTRALLTARENIKWYSPYDDRYVDGPRGLDIDHLVPLAEAWDSGAYAWTAKEREDYANDLGDERALIAVSAASNRSKADQDPSTWLPPAQGYRCQYVTDWIADKTRWGLSIDATEEAALTGELIRCPNAPITVTTAR
ncbi:HNH endonuclease family protein, partial [Streptomyces sp. ATE26]